MDHWRPDVLGEGFEQLTLRLGEDDEGEIVATLVRALPERRGWWQRMVAAPPPFDGLDVLYVHGWSDYFFQTELARFWTSRGARFFALDLRKYGRSLRDGQTHGFISDLREYDADIHEALAAIDRSDGAQGRRLVLMGHSTGGLVLSLWADRHPGRCDALILNSPWLEFQLSSTVRKLLAPIVEVSAKWNPPGAAPQIDFGYYARALREVQDPSSPLNINEAWRPAQSPPVRSAWIRAILDGHNTVAHGLHLTVPVCVLLSRKTVIPTRWTEELKRGDSVINVDEVAKAALGLGSSITIEWIDGAIHDVFLSAAVPRADAYARMERWVTGFRATDRLDGTWKHE